MVSQPPGQDQQVSVIMAVVNHIHPGGRWVLMNVEHSSLGMLLTLLVLVASAGRTGRRDNFSLQMLQTLLVLAASAGRTGRREHSSL